VSFVWSKGVLKLHFLAYFNYFEIGSGEYIEAMYICPVLIYVITSINTKFCHETLDGAG